MPAPLPPRIFRPTPVNLARLGAALRRGDLVGVPSETVYGLAANALDEAACARIFEAKGRPTTDPLIVHLASIRELDSVAVSHPQALRLAAAFWPGPLTLVLPKRACVPDLVTAGKATVAVRVPAHPAFRKLIRACGRPLAAPSANPFGYISPTRADHVRSSLRHPRLRAVLDGGECAVGVESTILDLSDPAHPRLLRPGGLAAEAIAAVLGQPIDAARPLVVPAGMAATAPGMLAQHYSPRIPLTLHARIDADLLARLPDTAAVLLLRRPASVSKKSLQPAPARPGPTIAWLSENGDLAEIARHLFARLREFDTGRWSQLHAEIPSGAEGLAPAIRDRLTRAAAKRT